MFELAAEHETTIVSFAAIAVSALLGVMKKSKIRTTIFLALWLVPLIYAALSTIMARCEIEYEFGDWWALLAVSPYLLALWSVVTLFPFKLVVRLRKVHLGE